MVIWPSLERAGLHPANRQYPAERSKRLAHLMWASNPKSGLDSKASIAAPTTKTYCVRFVPIGPTTSVRPAGLTTELELSSANSGIHVTQRHHPERVI